LRRVSAIPLEEDAALYELKEHPGGAAFSGGSSKEEWEEAE